MNDFTAEHESYRRAVRDFAEKDLAPGAMERARLDYIDPEVIGKLARAGYLGMTTPASYGGNPKDSVSIGIVFEEISRVDYAPMPLLLNHVVTPLMMRWASDALREEWLPLLVRGRKLACFGNTEPHCGSDAVAIMTRAERMGDFYLLSGEKTSISMGNQADVMVLTAKTDREKGGKGISCFLVPLDLPGVSRQRFVDMGAHPHGRAAISLDEVQVPLGCRIGEEGEGFTKVMSGIDFCRVLTVLAGIGMARAALGDALEHIKRRRSFGHPLSRFEGISFRLAEDATLLQASRLLAYDALRRRDLGLRHTKEAAMAKWFGAECSTRVLHRALLLHGCLGYLQAHAAQQRFRDVIGLQIGDGTAEIMKLIIARDMLGGDFAPIF